MGRPERRRRWLARRALALLLVATVLVAAVATAGCLQVFRDRGAPGAWALEFLRDDPYPELIVEIDHEPGAAPEGATLQKLERVLAEATDKPGGIDVRVNGEVQGKGKGAKYSFDEIRDLEETHRDHRKGGDRAALYVIFLDGGSDQDSGSGRVLGAVYSGSGMVIFKDNIRFVDQRCRSQSLGLPGTCPPLRTFEDAVTTHELGHVLGLVNIGIPMTHDREDPDSPGHSTNQNSVMYRAVRSGDIIDFILRGNEVPTEFDMHDQNDLRRAREG